MPRDYRGDLASDNALLRGHAAAMLADSFEESDGERLVTAMLRETEAAAFTRISAVVMGKWAVMLERRLIGLPHWPLAPNCAVWFAIQSRMWSYPSYERFLVRHITGDDWMYKYAAVIYCRHHGFRFGLLSAACRELLSAIDIDGTGWDAAAISTGLRSKRRLRQKLERIAREMTPGVLPDELVPPSVDRSQPLTLESFRHLLKGDYD